MMAYRLVERSPDALQIWQNMYAGNGYVRVQDSVPPRPLVEGEKLTQHYVLDADEVPVGLLSVIELGEGMVEVGARFWEQNPRTGFLLDKWIRGLLGAYSAVVVRCYANNWPVKKLLQRGGFRMFRRDRVGKRTVEFFLVTSDTYLGRDE